MAKFLTLTLTNGETLFLDKARVTFFNHHTSGVTGYTALGIYGSSQPIFVKEPIAEVRRILGV